MTATEKNRSGSGEFFRSLLPIITWVPSYKRAWLRMDIMAGLAEFESSLIGERVRAGMARAKADGKRISRPPIDNKVATQIRRLRKAGKSLRVVAAELGVSRGTVANYS